MSHTPMCPRATDAVRLTFACARLKAFSPRVRKFASDFVCTLPNPSASTTTATGFAGLEGATFGTPGGHWVGNRRFGRSYASARKIDYLSVAMACSMHYLWKSL